MTVEKNYIDRVNYDIQMFKNNSTTNRILINRYNKLKFDYYSPICTYTTENLDSYLNTLNIENKRCLTVTSSGDQLINLALLGAHKVDCFDTNIISVYFTKLKLAALQALSYEQFLNFFSSTNAASPNGNILYFINDDYFKYETYFTFRKYLDKDVCLFFDKIYAYYNYDGQQIKDSGLFYNFPDDRAIFNNTYLKNEKKYYEARELTRKLVSRGIIFFTYDIFDLSRLQSKYDLILLSNIFEHLGDKKVLFSDYVKNNLCNILTIDGEVVVNYQYGYRQKKNPFFINNLAVYVSPSDDRYFNISNISELQGFTLIGVPSIYRLQREEGVEDCAYLYKRR